MRWTSFSSLMRKIKVADIKPLFFLVLFLLGAPFSYAASERALEFQTFAAIGFDDNPRLTAPRRSDFFAQETVLARYRKTLNPLMRLRLSSDIVNINYFEATHENLLPLEAAAGLDLKLAPHTILEMDYTFEYVDFPNDDPAVFLEHKARAGLRQRVSRTLELKGGVDAASIGFEEQKTRDAAGVLSAGKERGDARLGADTEINFLPQDNLLFKSGFVYFHNDSNDLFHDFYDYDSYKVYAGASNLWNPKLSASFRFSYEKRQYDARPLVDDASMSQDDDVYTAGGTLFYNIRNGLSLGLAYSYREKSSNEPSQSYSGAISTLGLYYSF